MSLPSRPRFLSIARPEVRARRAALAVFAASALLLGGCSSLPSADPAVRSVPALQVAFDCGDCQVNPKVPVLIAEGYAAAAGKSGHTVDNSATATLTIKGYRERSTSARLMLGMLAGKDEIKAVLAAPGRTARAVEESYINAWMGMETLADKIGQMAHAEMAAPASR